VPRVGLLGSPASELDQPPGEPAVARLLRDEHLAAPDFFADQSRWYQKSFTSWSNCSWVGGDVSMVDGSRSGNDMPSA
jgi:hypothetical protein